MTEPTEPASWWDETHRPGLELCRHFFRRFFDSDLVSSARQWQVLAVGFFAIVLSLSIPLTQAYYHKYRMLLELDSPEPYRMAAVADHLFLICFAMNLSGLVTAMQWASLFPGLQDYLVMAGLPVRTRDIFAAKFTALLTYMGVFIVGLCAPPALVLPWVMVGRYFTGGTLNGLAPLIPMLLAAFFVFFVLLALQGFLLNAAPPRLFAGVSLLVQCTLLVAQVCLIPFVMSVPSLARYMNLRPASAFWMPPAWFLGLDQAILGNREPFMLALARLAVVASAGAVLSAVLAYLWSYRRQKVRLLETPVRQPHEFLSWRRWKEKWSDRLLPDPSEHAVFDFALATLTRSRVHRLVLAGFVAVAFALIVENFVSLVAGGSFRGFAVKTFALRQAAVSAPLALALFVLAGYRYLFRLPVELRANWVFRVYEGGNRRMLLRGMERFVYGLGVLPILVLTLPLEVRVFGAITGVGAALLAFLPSLTMQEILLTGFERIPFTSAYLPAKRPLIETVVIYGAAVGAYVGILSGIIVYCLEEPRFFLIAFGCLLAIWARVRKNRLEYAQVGVLEFEELPEPAVQTLAIFRD